MASVGCELVHLNLTSASYNIFIGSLITLLNASYLTQHVTSVPHVLRHMSGHPATRYLIYGNLATGLCSLLTGMLTLVLLYASNFTALSECLVLIIFFLSSTLTRLPVIASVLMTSHHVTRVPRVVRVAMAVLLGVAMVILWKLSGINRADLSLELLVRSHDSCSPDYLTRLKHLLANDLPLFFLLFTFSKRLYEGETIKQDKDSAMGLLSGVVLAGAVLARVSPLSLQHSTLLPLLDQLNAIFTVSILSWTEKTGMFLQSRKRQVTSFKRVFSVLHSKLYELMCGGSMR